MSSPAKTRARKSSVSLATVAAHAGVSKMTASRVLRGGTGFSSETRDRVLQASAKLGYLPNKLAAAFASERANTLIGIAIPTLSRELFGQILEGIEGKLSAVGYQPIVGVVGYSDALEHQWLSSVLAWRPGGIIIAGRSRCRRNIELLRSLQIPTVEIWNLNPEPNDISVGFNHFAAGCEMGDYLTARYAGRFGYVGVRASQVKLGEKRLAGFRHAVEKAHGSSKENLQTHFLNDRSSFYAGYYGTEQLLSSHPHLRALYFLDDNMAFGGLMLCQNKGLQVPADIAIAGFGGMDIGSVMPQRLTTTKAFRLRIGKLAAESLLKRAMSQALNPVQDVGFELVEGDTA